MSRVVVTLAVFLVLSGSVNLVTGGIFPPSFYSNLNTGTDDNSVDPQNDESVGTISEDDFTAMRIEYIKNQILKKLRLKEKPQIAISDLPKPIQDNENQLLSDHDMDLSMFDDDFYAKTTQAIVLPYEAFNWKFHFHKHINQEDFHKFKNRTLINQKQPHTDDARCLRKVNYPSSCLPFQMPNDIHSSDVSTAELWFHKKPDVMDGHNQTFIIYEVAHWDTNKSFQKTNPIAIHDTNLKEGWLKIDVSYVVKNWLEYQHSPIHAINVICKTCGLNKSQSPLSSSGDLRPFLIIYTYSQQRRAQIHRRQKRSSECSNSPNECCRESLYVSFKDIGWSDWIIKPEGYNAYFCRGSCTTPTAIMNSASHHNSILQKVMGKNNQRGSRPELTPCCAATQFQSLNLIYMDGNKTLSTKLLSNMIVETCGCM